MLTYNLLIDQSLPDPTNLRPWESPIPNGGDSVWSPQLKTAWLIRWLFSSWIAVGLLRVEHKIIEFQDNTAEIIF